MSRKSTGVKQTVKVTAAKAAETVKESLRKLLIRQQRLKIQ